MKLIIWFITITSFHPFNALGPQITEILIPKYVWNPSPPAIISYLDYCNSLVRRRQWQPTPVLLPGKSHGCRTLVGCSPWGLKESTWLSDFTFTFHFHAWEKEMATHSSVLACRIPGTGQPGGLPSMGSQSRTRLKRLSSSSSHGCWTILSCVWGLPWWFRQ